MIITPTPNITIAVIPIMISIILSFSSPVGGVIVVVSPLSKKCDVVTLGMVPVCLLRLTSVISELLFI